MSQRPELPEGYLGPQAKFGELGLSTASHSNPEIKLQENEVEIKLKTTTPVKVTATLIACKDGKEYPELIFSQSCGDIVSFVINFPESGFFKLQLYALAMDDQSKSLPGVFNYLMNVVRALKAVYPFPKQFAQWKKGCYLHEPMILHKGSRLVNVPFKVSIPTANAAAIVADGEWQHLEKKDKNEDVFTGKITLDKYRGTDTKITLNANFVDDETKYTGLLEYKVN